VRPRPRFTTASQLRITVSACAVCAAPICTCAMPRSTHEMPVILGHQIVGRTDEGRRVGAALAGGTDEAAYCR